ncbi:PREDICTED: subtilisin-like protease SBT1.1 [Ipomoea nil]|uniref:subtilisin-like protease SBT1.1 n=1 Tax=Ipomoea nil TaxID=35883 RepID=UPI000901BCF1|nr:PREDICTED: subtilisin-like protease SBT1.1 [Ipomoea nil]
MVFKIFLILLALSLPAVSEASVAQDMYVVHMDPTKIPESGTSTSAGGSRTWYEAVLDSVTEFSASESPPPPPPQLLYVYETAVSGFAAKLSRQQLESLKHVHGFLAAVPDEMLTLHTTHSPQFLGLRNGKGLWGAKSLASDVIVGVVDTGIWPEHISFRDAGIMSPVPARWKGTCEAGRAFSPSNCNKKLVGARTFYKGYESIVGKINETVEYKSPRDSEGHGTHTASTAAGDLVKDASFLGLARGSAGGMKYTARIAAYKACYTLGCSSIDVLAAVDQAVKDGVDILSLSLGGLLPKPFYTDNIAIAAFGATQKGVFVCSSAGNSGPLTSSVSNTAPWIMTVAASSLDRRFPAMVELGNGRVFRGESLYSGKAVNQKLPLVYGRTAGGKGAEFCSHGSLSSRLVKGRIVVCERGNSARAEKGSEVKRSGGAGMILINRETEGEEVYADPHFLPATALGFSAGIAVKKYINSSKSATASIKFQGTVYGNRAPVMAAFSSRGPSAVSPEIIKPDVTAPGVNILAAWPPNIGPTMLEADNRSVEFNILSGTSMSCPHVSGLAALLKSVHGDWSPAAIKSALMTTSYTLDSRKSPITDSVSTNPISATPFAFGSGHVDPERAAHPGLIYDISTQDYFNYLCSLNYNSTQISLLLRKKSACPTHHHHQPGDLNYPSFAVIFDSSSSNSSHTFTRTATNVGIPESVYAVHVMEPDGVSVIVKPKVLKFNKMGQNLSYTVSFVAQRGKIASGGGHSFGSLVWKSTNFTVRSPIAVIWQ